MKNIILLFSISFGSLRAFTNNDGIESLSDAWSSEEKTDVGMESDQEVENSDAINADISSSEESSEDSEFIKGIEKLLKDFWYSKEDKKDRIDVSKSEDKVADNTAIEEEEKMTNYEIKIDKSSESQKEPSNVIWTYVLWRPRVLEDNDHLLPRLSDYQSYNYLKTMADTWLQNEDEKDEGRQGWRDDRKQLDLPRVAALTSDDEPDFYENLVDSFNGMNKKIHEVASTPGVKQNILYVLIGLTGFLMLTLVNDNFIKKKESRTTQDHYLLADTGASAKLPTYEECIKADKNILVTLADTEVFNKVDLSLPVPAVDTEIKEEEIMEK